MVLHALQQRLRQADLQRQPLQIDQVLRRRFGVARALGELQLAVFAQLHVVQRFQCRGRGAHHHRDILFPGAEHRQIAGVVAPAFLLFIRAVVLFVDDDHAQLTERREQRRAGADDDGGFAAARAAKPPAARCRSGRSAVRLPAR